jgi:hypothetical protein
MVKAHLFNSPWWRKRRRTGHAKKRALGCLAVAASSPGYAAAYTYSTPYPYGAPYAVESPPAQAASCASTTTATSKAEADSATSAAATSATTSAASAASATTATTAATSGELNSGLERTNVFFVEDVKSHQADVRDFFLT